MAVSLVVLGKRAVVRTSLDGLSSIFDLEHMSVRTAVCKYNRKQICSYRGAWADLKTRSAVELACRTSRCTQLMGCLPERALSYPDAILSENPSYCLRTEWVGGKCGLRGRNAVRIVRDGAR